MCRSVVWYRCVTVGDNSLCLDVRLCCREQMCRCVWAGQYGDTRLCVWVFVWVGSKRVSVSIRTSVCVKVVNGDQTGQDRSALECQ